MKIIQEYAPTTVYGDSDVEEFYQKLEEVKAQAETYEINIAIGNPNEKYKKEKRRFGQRFWSGRQERERN